MGGFMVRFAIQYSLLYHNIIFSKAVKVSPKNSTSAKVLDFRFHTDH